jgi:hypothetical protein
MVRRCSPSLPVAMSLLEASDNRSSCSAGMSKAGANCPK